MRRTYHHEFMEIMEKNKHQVISKADEVKGEQLREYIGCLRAFIAAPHLYIHSQDAVARPCVGKTKSRIMKKAKAMMMGSFSTISCFTAGADPYHPEWSNAIEQVNMLQPAYAKSAKDHSRSRLD
jgi:hypothetical protein